MVNLPPEVRSLTSCEGSDFPLEKSCELSEPRSSSRERRGSDWGNVLKCVLGFHTKVIFVPIGEEVTKTYKMVKDAGFEVVDVVFEGAMTVEKKDILAVLQGLAEEQKAMGSVKIIYSVAPDQLRTIEIPVGEVMPEEAGKEELPTL